MDIKIKKNVEVKNNKVIQAYDKKRREIVEKAIKVVEDFFEGRTTDFNIIFIDSRDEMDRIHSSYMGQEVKTEDWFVGSVYGDENVYVIDIDVFDKITCYKRENFFPTLVHEMTHVFMKNIFDFHLPMWLGEGIAYVVANQDRGKELSPEEDLKKAYTEQEWCQYHPSMLSALFIRHLIEKFGKKKLFELFDKLDVMQSKEGFIKKFKEVYNVDFEDELDLL